MEQNVDIPAVGGSGTGGGLSGFLPGQNYSMTAEQIVDNPVPHLVVLEVFKVFVMDRVQQRPGVRSVFLGFSWTSWSRVFFRTFPTGKSAKIPRTPGVRTGCALELMDAVSLAGVSSVAQHGVRLLLLVAANQNCCFLVCSSGPPSYPLAWSSCWCRLRLATRPSGGFWKNFLFYVPFAALFAPGNLDIAIAPVSFSPSVFGCCLWSTLVFGTRAWFNSGYMFYEELLANFTYFLTCGALRSLRSSLFRRMEKCAQLMLRVAVSLRALRTLNLDIISTSSPCDGCWVTLCASFFAFLWLCRS